VTVTVFADKTAIPQSLSSLALQMQRAINQALVASAQLPGASVQVYVTTASGGTRQGLRLVASVPHQPDAVLSITPPPTSTPPLNNAVEWLGLTAPTATSTP